MSNYTPSEILSMISIRGECQKDYRANAWLRRERLPDHRLGEEICTDNVVDSSHDRSSTRSNFFKFSYQSANIVKTNHGMSHVTHLMKPRSRIVDYWIDIAAIIESMKPPHWQRSVDCRRQWSLNVWYGIVKGHLVNLNYLMEH